MAIAMKRGFNRSQPIDCPQEQKEVAVVMGYPLVEVGL